MRRIAGFMLIEVLIVLAIIAFLSAISIPSFMKFLAKSKRSEAYMTLRGLYLAEKSYQLEHGTYTAALMGKSNALGWKPSGSLLYTYGFPGSAGTNFVMGELKAPGSALKKAGVTSAGFVAAAAADIDGDGVIDLLTIDQDGKITIVVDDLAE